MTTQFEDRSRALVIAASRPATLPGAPVSDMACVCRELLKLNAEHKKFAKIEQRLSQWLKDTPKHPKPRHHYERRVEIEIDEDLQCIASLMEETYVKEEGSDGEIMVSGDPGPFGSGDTLVGGIGPYGSGETPMAALESALNSLDERDKET